MIVDIGGGTTEGRGYLAVRNRGAKSVRVGGDEMDQAIVPAHETGFIT